MRNVHAWHDQPFDDVDGDVIGDDDGSLSIDPGDFFALTAAFSSSCNLLANSSSDIVFCIMVFLVGIDVGNEDVDGFGKGTG